MMLDIRVSEPHELPLSSEHYGVARQLLATNLSLQKVLREEIGSFLRMKLSITALDFMEEKGRHRAAHLDGILCALESVLSGEFQSELVAPVSPES